MRTGLILAGGASRRFGEAKALAPFDGKPMVRWVAETLSTRSEELLLSVATDAPLREFEAAMPGARMVRDARKDRGPIEGFRQGFAAAQGDLVLVAPSDAPLLRPALYDALLALLGDRDAAVPRRGALDPVRAVYRRDAVVRALGANELESPSALVDRLDAVFLEGERLRAVDPHGLSFIDVNRREDLDAALQMSPRHP